jgi:hypothetical protein
VEKLLNKKTNRNQIFQKAKVALKLLKKLSEQSHKLKWLQVQPVAPNQTSKPNLVTHNKSNPVQFSKTVKTKP